MMSLLMMMMMVMILVAGRRGRNSSASRKRSLSLNAFDVLARARLGLCVSDASLFVGGGRLILYVFT